MKTPDGSVKVVPVAVATVDVTTKKPGFFSSGFWHALWTGDGSGPLNTAESIQKTINDASSAFAKTNGTSVDCLDGEDEDPALRELKLLRERDRNYGVELAVAGAVVEGAANTEHKLTSGGERWGVKIHNFLVGKAESKIKAKVEPAILPYSDGN